MKKIFFTLLLSVTSTTLLADKWTINVEVDAHARSNYVNCQGYATSICELIRSYVDAQDSDARAFVAELIISMKKQLHKCEKHNKHESTVDAKIGGSYEFDTNNSGK